MASHTSEESTSRWATTVVLGDGSTAFIRPLVPADQEALLAFHERQSPESLYRRFFSAKPTLNARELAHFTTVDMVDRVALCVEIRDEFVAWSSYERWSGRDEAEAAFMVDDGYHGRGIATLMLEHLAAIGRANGVERFTAEVLSDNRGMLAVFSKAGWPLQRRFESGVIDLDWDVAVTDDFIDTVERREQRADSRAVARIVQPRAVAVVGASDRDGSVGAMLWTHIRNSVDVPVYPVNPRLEDIDGQRCFGSVDDLPDDVSLAVVAVPTRQLVATIDACIAKRMRGAIIVTAPTSADGTVTVDLGELVGKARRNGLRIIGPSSMGIAALHGESALQAALVDVTLPAGGVAISMQSGSLGGSLLRRARDLQLGLSWFISLGDKSDVSANDFLQFWEDDHKTTVVGLYTETFGNPRKFARIARRVSRSKPIVAVRTGAAAHDDAGEALYQQAGLIEVPSVPALLDVCRLLSTQPVLRGPRICVISNSVSPGALAGAALESRGLSPLEPAAQPLNWTATPDDYHAAIATALNRPDVDGILVVFAPPVPAFEAAMGPTISAAAKGASKPVVAVMIGSGDGPVEPNSNVPGYAFPEQAADALVRSHEYGQWLATEALDDAAVTRSVDPRLAATQIEQALAHASGADPIEMSVAHASELLGTYSIPVATAASATPVDAGDVATDIGFPVAVKARVRHRGRSVRSGVALDLADVDAVTAAVAAMAESLGADADHLVVQQMTEPGVDVRIRCRRDDRLGVMVEVGYGGIDADLIDDRSSRLAPTSPASARAMLDETKAGAAIRDASLDPSPLVDVIVQTAQLCADHPDIDLVDLNPVILSTQGACATDVNVVLLDRPDDDGPIRRLD